MNLETVLNSIINLADPGFKDWIIMVGAVGIVLFKLLVWSIGRIDKQREKQEAEEKAERETKRQKDERLETYLSAELERLRGEMTTLQKRCTELEEFRHRGTAEADALKQTIKRHRDRIKYLERLLNRKGVSFKSADEENYDD